MVIAVFLGGHVHKEAAHHAADTIVADQQNGLVGVFLFDLIEQSIDPVGQVEAAFAAGEAGGHLGPEPLEFLTEPGGAVKAAKIEFHQSVVDLNGNADGIGHRLGGLPRPEQGRAEDHIDALVQGGLGQELCLLLPHLGQGDIGSAADQILITRNCKPAGRIKFVLVGEELGF